LKLDLHGVRHREVDRLVENFVFNHQANFPLAIITGHSPKMKNIVKEVLERNKMDYMVGNYSQSNMGMITVLGFKV
jgi:hypothetical protein